MDNIYFYEALIFLISGFVHSVVGFGFPMLATPLLSIFVSVKEAVLLTLFPNIAINLNIIKRTSSFSILWSEYKLLIIPVVLGSFIGTNLLVLFYSEYYKVLLGLITLLYLNRTHINFSLHETIKNNPKTMMILFGGASGLIGGLVNVMLPLLIIYALESGMEKEKSFATMNFCFFSSKMTQVIVFGLNGDLSLDFSFLIIPIVLISLLGFYLGNKVRHKVNEKLYKQILLMTLWCLSFYLIINPFL
jgi:uncharacterized membrane protein YfcA